ncbi:GLI pathogenesis-related 2 [Eucyclogobius newberryi]|uniref:GLI pathogenesis-related 2 n=1 Tax=Eucyclogobius newberryi TaxID=166745 RepID=UPI003B5AAB5D
MANESFKKAFLDTHNALRAQHSAAALSYNSELCATAQKWADHLLQQKGVLGHSETSDGENIYCSQGSGAPNGKDAVDSWYGEVKDYDYKNPGFSSKTGHFTQVVWKDSKELGLGMSTNGSLVIVVGQYRPAGNMNMPGYFEKNVLSKDESFKKAFLDTHNALRAQHSAAALSYNSELCATAQKWADHLLQQKGVLGHSETSDGENIYCSQGSGAPNGKDAVDSWYGEVKDYDYKNPGFSSKTGHFTQVVWKDSKELGLGMSTNGSLVIVVGQYRPAGNMNMPGYFEKNVLSKDASFKREFLNAHNTYRSQHSAPPLGLSSELCAEAQRWAEHLLQRNIMKHSETSDGENIYCFRSSAAIKLAGREAVDAWYSEIKYYSWNSPGYSSKTGHFTQVVWKDSTELGVGVASSGKRVYVVGQYRPAGNVNSPMYFQQNVLPKGKALIAGSLKDIPKGPGPGFEPGETKVTCCSLL